MREIQGRWEHEGTRRARSMAAGGARAAVLPPQAAGIPQAGGKTWLLPSMCKVRPEVCSAHTFFLAVASSGYLGQRRTGKAVGMVPQNTILQ